MSYSTSLNDTDFIDEVRDSLAGFDSSKVPDDTITQQRDRFVEPAVNNGMTEGGQDEFDNAVIAWTAERAFKSWLPTVLMSDGNFEIEKQVKEMRRHLEERTKLALQQVGMTPQSNNSNYVKSVN